jgi:tetratricopeptide (TPR) repeat protein
VEEEMQKASDELGKFDKVIIRYYNQIETNPTEVLKQTEKLVEKVKSQPDPNNVRWNKLGSLFDLRAETFYTIGEYQNSIKEIHQAEQNNQETLGGNFSFGSQSCINLACNYVKLKDFDKAKIFLDSAGKGIYMYEKANFFEAIGNRSKALEIYLEIKKDKSIDHYYYYQDALKRIEELRKPNAKLLREIHYKSSRSDKEICRTDNARRERIFN